MGFILERLNSRGAIKYEKTAGEVQTQKCALHEKEKQNGTNVQARFEIEIMFLGSKMSGFFYFFPKNFLFVKYLGFYPRIPENMSWDLQKS